MILNSIIHKLRTRLDYRSCYILSKIGLYTFITCKCFYALYRKENECDTEYEMKIINNAMMLKHISYAHYLLDTIIHIKYYNKKSFEHIFHHALISAILYNYSDKYPKDSLYFMSVNVSSIFHQMIQSKIKIFDKYKTINEFLFVMTFLFYRILYIGLYIVFKFYPILEHLYLKIIFVGGFVLLQLFWTFLIIMKIKKRLIK
jgi:hypothetical protein